MFLPFYFLFSSLFGSAGGTDPDLKTLSLKFDSVNTLVRDGKIKQPEVVKFFRSLMPQLKNTYYKESGKDYPLSDWRFPVRNYQAIAIGGKNGDGYLPKGYSYFDGNKHAGHPAHDIFITDKNQDGIDDKTNSRVEIVSISGGVVVALENKWAENSLLRGGKYVWIYDPTTNSLFYYAHNDTLMVSIGQPVKPGDVIATMGRTGFNAFKKRSPTHLHVMRLQFDSHFQPLPIDLYPDLRRL